MRLFPEQRSVQMDDVRSNSRPRHRFSVHNVPTVFEYLQNPIRSVSKTNYDRFNALSSIEPESLPTLKIQALDVENDDWRESIGLHTKQLAPLREPLPRSEKLQKKTPSPSSRDKTVHRLSVQPAGHGIERRQRCLVWMPARKTKAMTRNKLRSRSCPLPESSSPSRQSSPYQHTTSRLHVALLPCDVKYRIVPRSPPQLPKLKKTVHFRQTPLLLGAHSSEGGIRTEQLHVSVSGSSLTEKSTRKPLQITAPEENADPSVPQRTTGAMVPALNAASTQQATIAVKDISVDLPPSASTLKTSLSAELLAGSLSSVLRGGKDQHLIASNSTSQVSPGLSRITLPQAPFESSSTAVGLGPSASGTSLNSLRVNFQGLRLSQTDVTTTNRTKRASPMLEGEGLHLSPRGAASSQRIEVVIPSPEPRTRERPSLSSNGSLSDDEEMTVPRTPAHSLASAPTYSPVRLLRTGLEGDDVDAIDEESHPNTQVEVDTSVDDTSMGMPSPN